MPPLPIVDPATIDTSKIFLDLSDIREGNPQRFEMEQLTAIVHVDEAAGLIIGYKDYTPDEFWIPGHFPDMPLLPGVLMCEAAAQLCSFFCYYIKLLPGSFLGFGGMDEVRFRGKVSVGDRLVIVAKTTRLNKRQTIFDTQGFVDGQMVYHGRMIGIPLPRKS